MILTFADSWIVDNMPQVLSFSYKQKGNPQTLVFRPNPSEPWVSVTYYTMCEQDKP